MKASIIVFAIAFVFGDVSAATSQIRTPEPENSLSSVFQRLALRYCDKDIPPDIEYDALFSSLQSLGERLRKEAGVAARGSERRADRLDILTDIQMIHEEAQTAKRASDEALEPYRQLCKVLKNPELLR